MDSCKLQTLARRGLICLPEWNPAAQRKSADSSQNQDCPKTVHVLAARSPFQITRRRCSSLGSFVVGTCANPEMETRQDSGDFLACGILP